MASKSVINLDSVSARLPGKQKELFHRIFRFSQVTGRLELPRSMEKWTREKFGSVGSVKRQKITKVTNMVTGDSSFFNELRSRRPLHTEPESRLNGLIGDNCAFCSPERNTPPDVFGRVKGKHCITASNIAKYDAWHGLIIFREHNPLDFSLAKISDYLDTAGRWFRKVLEEDRKAVFPFFMWNCLWNAGASIVHGHAQVTASREPHGKVERLLECQRRYFDFFGTDYFDDLYDVHDALGLAENESGARVMASVTPLKDREIIILSTGTGSGMKKALYKSLKAICSSGACGFNVAVSMPPFMKAKGWEGFPFVTRVLCRGNPLQRTSDIGSMELYASSIISSDPYDVIRQYRKQ